MAGWSMRADGSSLDYAKTQEKFDLAGSLIDIEPFLKGSFLKSEPDKLSFWFNKVLGSFSEEICSRDCFWPLPPMLGDGQPVDLLKLFLVVRDKGGYNAVSDGGLWDLVAKESGFGLNVASSVKSIYVKYLVSLDRFLERIVQSEDMKSESNCSGQLMELGAELKGFLLESNKKVAESSQVEDSVVAGAGSVSDEGEKCVKDEESMCIDLTKRVLDYEEVKKLQNDDVDSDSDKKSIHDDYEDMPSDLERSVVNSSDDEKMCDEDEVKSALVDGSLECKKCEDSDDEDDVVVILDSNDVKEKFSSLKRKRDSMWGMLHWVTEIAKDPCNLVVGSLPEWSRWKFYGTDEFWKQVLLFREATFRRKDDHSSAESNWQKSQKMHPCMYEDNTKVEYNLRERLSGNKELLLGKMTSKGQDQSSPSSAGNQSDLDGSMVGKDKHLHGTQDSTTPGSVFDYDVDIHVPLGPYFQVEVPDWTGVASESDAKWLGTRVWPLEKKENRFLIERDRIGKGRQDSCGCHIQDSVHCVKFHVAEKRSKVKLELGSAFNQWKFDKMGEDVAVAWKEEEQKMFSSIVKSNPLSLEKRFWDEIYKCFPNKSREELVCYYYNFFLLQRRAHQNRNTPSNINSDDDESEAESPTKGTGHEAIKSHTSILISPKKSQKKSRYSSSSK